MKTLMKISLLVNVGVLGGWIWLWANGRAAGSDSTSPALGGIPPVAGQATSLAEPKPFRWSQLESTNDYRVYVANLRAAGCPEPTVKNIVTGDVAMAFSFRRRQLGLDGSGTGAWSRQLESQMLDRLLGEPAAIQESSASPNDPGQMPGATRSASAADRPPASVAAAAPAEGGRPAAAWPRTAPAAPPEYPLVFQTTGLNALGLNDRQKTAIQQVQQQFVNDLGGPNQNPSDPAYLARWVTAQNSADQALIGILGNDAYNAYQLQHYYANFEQAIVNSGGNPLTVNPAQLAK